MGKFFLLYIPGVPYVSRSYSRVDELVLAISKAGGEMVDLIGIGPAKIPVKTELPGVAAGKRVLFRNSFAAAVAGDLRASKVCPAEFCVKIPEGRTFDYYVTGTLKDTGYRATVSSWLLGIAGMSAWMIPLPMTKVTGWVKLELRLLDAATGEVVWRRTERGEESSYRTLYGISYMPYDRGLRGWGFSIIQGSDNESLPSRSVFWWHFMALKDAMRRLKPALAGALRKLQQP